MAVYDIFNYTDLGTTIKIDGLVAGTAYSGAVNIPSTIGSKPVLYISTAAFLNCTGITSVSMPDSITIIQDYAFSGCTGLANINISKGLTAIGIEIFKNCGFASISIPNTITSIGSYAFAGCSNLRSVVIPSSVTSLDSSVFFNCINLLSAVIPGSISNISAGTFSGCDNLVDVQISEGVTSIGGTAFYSCDNLRSIVIPSSVINIGNNAFHNCFKLDYVLFMGNIPTTIGTDLFYNTPVGFTARYEYGTTGWGTTFQGYTTSLTISKPATFNSFDIGNTIDGTTCVSIGLAGTTVPTTTKADIIIPEKVGDKVVTALPYRAFYNFTNIKSVKIPDTVITIGDEAFNQCYGLKTANIPVGITSIPTKCFYYCTSLTAIEIPSTVTSIGSYAFAECAAMTGLKFNDRVSGYADLGIGDRAFYNCSSLIEVTLPWHLSSFGSYVFNASGLTKATFLCFLPSEGTAGSTFLNCGSGMKAYYNPTAGMISSWAGVSVFGTAPVSQATAIITCMTGNGITLDDTYDGGPVARIKFTNSIAAGDSAYISLDGVNYTQVTTTDGSGIPYYDLNNIPPISVIWVRAKLQKASETISTPYECIFVSGAYSYDFNAGLTGENIAAVTILSMPTRATSMNVLSNGAGTSTAKTAYSRAYDTSGNQIWYVKTTSKEIGLSYFAAFKKGRKVGIMISYTNIYGLTGSLFSYAPAHIVSTPPGTIVGLTNNSFTTNSALCSWSGYNPADAYIPGTEGELNSIVKSSGPGTLANVDYSGKTLAITGLLTGRLNSVSIAVSNDYGLSAASTLEILTLPNGADTVIGISEIGTNGFKATPTVNADETITNIKVDIYNGATLVVSETIAKGQTFTASTLPANTECTVKAWTINGSGTSPEFASTTATTLVDPNATKPNPITKVFNDTEITFSIDGLTVGANNYINWYLQTFDMPTQSFIEQKISEVITSTTMSYVIPSYGGRVVKIRATYTYEGESESYSNTLVIHTAKPYADLVSVSSSLDTDADLPAAMTTIKNIESGYSKIEVSTDGVTYIDKTVEFVGYQNPPADANSIMMNTVLHSGLTPNTNYTYYVRLTNSAGEEVETGTFYTAALPPINVVVDNTNPVETKLSFDPDNSGNATPFSFMCYVYVKVAGNWDYDNPIQKVENSTSPLTATGLSPNTSYCFRLYTIVQTISMDLVLSRPKEIENTTPDMQYTEGYQTPSTSQSFRIMTSFFKKWGGLLIGKKDNSTDMTAQFNDGVSSKVAIRMGPPLLGAISPAQASAGAQAMVVGKNLGLTRCTQPVIMSVIFVDGIEVTDYALWTDTQIIFNIPSNVTIGTKTVSIRTISGIVDGTIEITSGGPEI